eukprot:161834_1
MADSTCVEVDPLKLLEEELKCDDYSVAVEASRQLDLVASALGPEKTKSDLIPLVDRYSFPVGGKPNQTQDSYANFQALDAKEEILASLGSQMTASFVPRVGGPKAACEVLIPYLEKLCVIEETVVREAAASSLCSIFSVLSVEDVDETGFVVLQKLSQEEWFSGRISAASMCCALYEGSTDEGRRTEIRKILKKLCTDDMPMVRKTAYGELAKFILLMEEADIVSDGLPLFEKVMDEVLDSHRVCGIDISISLMKKLSNEKLIEYVVPHMCSFARSPSWKLKLHFCEKLPAIFEASDPHILNETLLSLFAELLSDREPQVRKVAISQLAPACKHVDPAYIVSKIVPIFKDLAGDPIDDVRTSLASGIVDISEYAGKETSEEVLVPLMTKLFQDDSPLVKQELMVKLYHIVQVIGIDDMVSLLLPGVLVLFGDTKWRVRLAVVNELAALAGELGCDKFEENLLDILRSAFTDTCFQVRSAACCQIKLLIEKFGVDWAVQRVFPFVVNIFDTSPNYLHRMVPLMAAKDVAPLLSPAQNAENFLPVVLKTLEDNIVNVRFAGAKALQSFIPNLDPSVVESKVCPALKGLSMDGDDDVRYFVTETLKLC